MKKRSVRLFALLLGALLLTGGALSEETPWYELEEQEEEEPAESTDDTMHPNPV